MPNLRVIASVLVLAMLMSLGGCYNTYSVAPDEFRKLQSGEALKNDARLAAMVEDKRMNPEEFAKLENRGENDSVTVTTLRNQAVAVSRDSKLFVRSVGGRRYEVTPFNFSMASSQLVASDRDTLQPLADLQHFEIDHFSTGKTVALLTAAAAAAVGFIVVLIKISGSKCTTDNC